MNEISPDKINDAISLTAVLTMVAAFALVLLIYIIVYRQLKKFAKKTSNKWDDFMIDLFKAPLLWFLIWMMLKFFTHSFLKEISIYEYVIHTNNILLILSIAWILIKSVKLGNYLLQSRLNISIPDNLRARKSLTQLKVFESIANTVIVIVTISVILMTFDEAKVLGKSLLTSAGVIGIIVGFAAQKSIGMFLAGIQIAITQPISLDDVVIVEGEWGRIEDINLTYVVVRIWDERRLILPVNYFLEKPFQNWTRTSSNILGTVFLYVGYDLPVEAIRNILPGLLKDNSDWDGRVSNVQITNTNELYKELRILVSSSDASKNWDLRTFIREKVIDYIQTNYPESFAKVRLVNSSNDFLRSDKS